MQDLLDTSLAIEVAQKSNNAIAEVVAENLNRYGALVNGLIKKTIKNSAIYYDIFQYQSFESLFSSYLCLFICIRG